MDPIEKRELKRQAWMRLAAQRRRAGMLRGRVVVISLICFVALWSVVFAQMATGNDPVLGGKESAVATRTVASTSPTREIETADPREFEPDRETDSESESRATEVEVEPEAESASEATELAEIEAAEAEAAEVEAAELAEVEAAELEESEIEPLVTSQS
jgi:non-ribosomal peptide synthetase component E (peptide arylation enzyme)